MLSKILQLVQKQDFKQVIDLVPTNSKDIKLLELKGISALKINNYSTAYEVYANLCKLSPLALNYYHFALACMNLKKYNQAVSALVKSQDDQKLQIPSQINQAHCLIKLNNFEQAISLLLEITSKSPTTNQAWFMLLLQLRDKSKIVLLNETIKKSQIYIGKTESWNKANIYLIYNQTDYQTAIELIDKYQLNDDSHFKVLKAKCYSKRQEFHKSLELYKQIKDENNNADNNYNLAAAYSKLTSEEDLNQALEYADVCLSIDMATDGLINNKYHAAYHCKALVYQKLNNYSQALEEIEQALSIKPEYKAYLYVKAESLMNTGHVEMCLSTLNTLLEIDKDYQIALRLKGIVQLQQDQRCEAENTLSKALILDDTDQRSLAYYAIAKIAQNKKKEVEEFLGLGHFVKTFTFNPQPDYENLNAFNRAFENDIKQHSLLRKNPRGLAARNGYLTDDIFVDDTFAIQIYRKLLLEKIKLYIEQLPADLNHHMLRHKTQDFKINSWATWVKGDGFIDKHIHEESWISGAYYCTVPKITERTDNKKGYFEYGCIPDDIKIPIEKERGYIQPVEGKLVIFPSYLYHQTIPHESTQDRISIAFDLTPRCWKK